MEKLLELLNEYASTFSAGKWIERDVDDYPNPTIICSKKYGFIKRLVENDKIDRKNIDGLELIPILAYQNMIDDCDCGKSHWHPYTFVEYVDELLMLLSISDTPIDDLISYLK